MANPTLEPIPIWPLVRLLWSLVDFIISMNTEVNTSTVIDGPKSRTRKVGSSGVGSCTSQGSSPLPASR